MTHSEAFTQEKAELAEELRRAHSGDAWHGPAVGELVQGVSALDAAAHPVAGAHSIWELVLHLSAWRQEVARRLVTGTLAPPAAGDWPRPPAAGDVAWASALAGLETATTEVLAALSTFPAGRLPERAGDARDPALGSGVTWNAMLHGLAQHDAYHGGQIALLKKALALKDTP